VLFEQESLFENVDVVSHLGGGDSDNWSEAGTKVGGRQQRQGGGNGEGNGDKRGETTAMTDDEFGSCNDDDREETNDIEDDGDNNERSKQNVMR